MAIDRNIQNHVIVGVLRERPVLDHYQDWSCNGFQHRNNGFRIFQGPS